MRLITEVKLDFDDVLIVPKRSTLSSRKDVDLISNIQFMFKHSGGMSSL
jgi:IMP dehydrogenase/GMP reductase